MRIDELPYLDFAAADFSVLSPEVAAIRDASWCARTPYGIAVLRYAEVRSLLRDPRVRQGTYLWTRHNGVTHGPFAEWFRQVMVNLDGEDHARLRRLVNPSFVPRAIERFRGQFECIADELIDDVP